MDANTPRPDGKLSPELESFLLFCQSVSKRPDGVTAKCPSSSAARSLRRRFYRLREQLPSERNGEAYKLQASVVGRYMTVRPAQPTALDWQNLETKDDSLHFPEGNRLDHEV